MDILLTVHHLLSSHTALAPCQSSPHIVFLSIFPFVFVFSFVLVFFCVCICVFISFPHAHCTCCLSKFTTNCQRNFCHNFLNTKQMYFRNEEYTEPWCWDGEFPKIWLPTKTTISCSLPRCHLSVSYLPVWCCLCRIVWCCLCRTDVCKRTAAPLPWYALAQVWSDTQITSHFALIKSCNKKYIVKLHVLCSQFWTHVWVWVWYTMFFLVFDNLLNLCKLDMIMFA